MHKTRFACLFLGICLCLGTLVYAQVDLEKLRSLALTRYGQSTATLVDEWRAMIESTRNQDEMTRLKIANDFINQRIRWVQDPEAWGQKDYWATPLETMGIRMGDCEDFAIFKYTTLLLAGVNVDKLRITYVKAQTGGPNSQIHLAHMVLAYYETPGSVPLILDNLIGDIYPATKRTDLTPVYGFNSKGLWVGGAAAPATNNPGAKLSRWRDLLQRAASEGLG
ncbi:transglutaminase [Halioglobus maricola]|uniref:Transglutaminase n=1 Tax=Halioglobus maricola TaxID=2601894 RepID=A0A5P9NPS2_9GAMM|nr:transglutaminase-like cysteine peptidase [Halioglobus maricola]QFU76898.1 transglutaminase [Halioglobus maricola]